MALLKDFARVSRRSRCPICSRPDWCLISRDNLASPSRVICARVESSKLAGSAGWLHVLRNTRSSMGRRSRLHTACITAPPNRNFEPLSKRLQAAVDPDRLHAFAQELGLPASALRVLGIGLAKGNDLDLVGVRWASHAWTFPMRNHEGRVTGLRLRLPGGRKLSVRGSRQGLFLPTGLSGKCDRLFVAEGETDAAALHALGLSTVGRPGCRSCTRLVADFVQAKRPSEVVIVADADEVGQEGAKALVLHLVAFAPAVVVLSPADDHKDARDWVRAGATQADVLAAVAQVQAMRLTVRVVRGDR